NANTLVFRATFNEAVTNADAADFAVNGTTTATVTGVSTVSATVYDVTISGGDLAGFNGSVGLNLKGTPTITDLAGNPLPATEPPTDQTYTLDNAPTLAAAVSSASGPLTYGSAGSLTYTITVTASAADAHSVSVSALNLPGGV